MTQRPEGRPFSGRRTNLALLLLLGGALVTGLTAQALGSSALGWVAVVHGVIGLAILLVAPWKSLVVRKGLARRNPDRLVSLLFALLTTTVLVTGILHSIGWPDGIGSLTVLWVHVATALLLVPFAIWHVLARKTLPRRQDLTRRNLIRTGGLISAAAVAWFTADRAIALARLPGADRRFTGSHERSSFEPTGLPVTSWLDDRTPDIDATTWSLTVSDAAGGRSFGLAEVGQLPADDVTAALDCTSGWYSNQVWRGVRLDRLVEPGSARSLVAWSATGYARRFPVSDLDSMWLVTEVGGDPLSPGHGFPARIVAPNRRGFWWVKWVVRLETSDLPWWIQSPYPLT
jgi:DMSO/TMAO reductase YedYZ molybdopterin-dependent catalytic subunit